MRGKAFVVSCGTYPFKVLVSIGQTDEARRRSLKYHLGYTISKKNNAMQGLHGFVFDFGGDCLLALEHYRNDCEWYGVLVHESLHAVEKLFRHIDLPLSPTSSEAYAYQVEFLTTEVLKRVM